MKLSLSNIAWNPDEENRIFELFSRLPVSGIEVAPTKYWPSWQGANSENALEVRAQLQRAGFQVPALQAILFDKPELQLFGNDDSRKQLLQHLQQVADLAQALGAPVLVFGSPKNRDRGELSYSEAFRTAADFFTSAAEVCHSRAVQLCLEPNPGVYHCNFMTRWEEVRDMVEQVARPGIGIHLDTACIALEGGSVEKAIKACQSKISHFHVTEENLGDFSNPALDHKSIGQTLKDSGYDGWVSIEMRRPENPIERLEQAVHYVAERYL